MMEADDDALGEEDEDTEEWTMPDARDLEIFQQVHIYHFGVRWE